MELAVFGILGIVFAVSLYIILLVDVAKAAKIRGRHAGSWAVFSLFVTPLISFIALIALGETKDKWKEKIEEEELLRSQIRKRF